VTGQSCQIEPDQFAEVLTPAGCTVASIIVVSSVSE